MTDTNPAAHPGQPDENDEAVMKPDPASNFTGPDVFSYIDEEVAQITDAEIGERLRRTLHRAGYQHAGPCVDTNVPEDGIQGPGLTARTRSSDSEIAEMTGEAHQAADAATAALHRQLNNQDLPDDPVFDTEADLLNPIHREHAEPANADQAEPLPAPGGARPADADQVRSLTEDPATPARHRTGSQAGSGGLRLDRPAGWLGRMRARTALLVLAGSALFGTVATLAAGQEPGGLLGFFIIGGAIAAALGIRRGGAYLLLPAPALAFFAAAVVTGKIHDAKLGSSTTALGAGLVQWAAGIFLPAEVATIAVLLVAGGRWLLSRQPASGQPLLSASPAEPPASQRPADDAALPADDREPVPVKLSILMAAYNEERTIVRVVHAILSARFPCEVELIIVDDGSADATPDLLKEIDDPRVIVHRHAKNSGKGAGILTAASLATGTHLVPFDADMEYSPEDIADMLVPVIKGRCDVVYGVRLFGSDTVYQSYRHAAGNKALTHFTNILYRSYLTDLTTCLKLMPTAMFRELNLTETGFGLDTQVTAMLLRARVRPFEVPVSYYSRSAEQGKKTRWRDAFTSLRILLKVRMTRPRRLFAPGATLTRPAPVPQGLPSSARPSGAGPARAAADREGHASEEADTDYRSARPSSPGCR